MFKVIKAFLSAAVLLSTTVFSLPASGGNVARAADYVTVEPVGDVAFFRSESGSDTRLLLQDSTGAIVRYAVNGAFNKGGVTDLATIVPAGEAKWGTAIAASTLPAASDGFPAQNHVFFFSPDNVLSEYIIDPDTAGWTGGANCTNGCITANGWLGCGTGDVLYAMEDPTTNELRVGFVSAAAPDTLTEAINDGKGWTLAELTTQN